MEYEKIYTSDMSDSQWEIIKEILKEENYRCVEEEKRAGECCAVPCQNRVPVEKSAHRFSKMENSIQLLSAGMSEWNMAENTAGISKKSTHPCRKKGRTDLYPD